MKRIIPILTILFAAATISCTDFKEEEIPVSFGVDVSQMEFASTSSTRSVTVSSGGRWDIPSMPSWISLGAISRSGHSPYEWTAFFSADENNEYDREGLIKITAGSDSAEISVTQEGQKGKYIAVESISLSSTELILTVGEDASLVYTISPANASSKLVSWDSSSPSIATIDAQSGRVNAIAEGTTLITVTTDDGRRTATCKVTVNAKIVSVTGVGLDMTSLTMAVGDVQTLVATVAPTNASNKVVSWSSSNTSVATVSSSGVVTAKNVGSATITVTTNDGGIQSTCSVSVIDLTEIATNLSTAGTANCYIVNSSGWYCIDATYKGSSHTDYIGSITSAEVLWESFNTSEKPSIGALIDKIRVEGNTLFFSVAERCRPGNALVCVKNGKNILWSWHIWITDCDINASSQRYSSGAVLMDRNLGALSAEPGSVLSFGLLYQWGRKDPFLGSSEIISNTSDSSNPVAEATNSHKQPVQKNAETGTIEYSIQHPMTPIQCDMDSYDWLYSSTGVSDDTRWAKNKTIYDPCPVGWQIPSESIWIEIFKGVTYDYSFIDNSLMDFQNRGVDLYNYTGKHCWFPFAGQIDPNASQYLLIAGRGGYWWTYNSYQSRAGCMDIWHDANGLRIYPLSKNYKAQAYSVRCVKQP